MFPSALGVVADEDYFAVLAALSDADRRLLMMTAAAALSELHGRGIAHGSLSSSTVLLVRGASGHYTARLLPPFGTATEEPTPEADIFSLGLLFHEYLTGHSPSQDAPGGALMPMPGIPACYRELIGRMLAAVPAARPTAAEVLAALRQSSPSAKEAAFGPRGPITPCRLPDPMSAAPPALGYCEPREADGIALDTEAMAAKGWVSAMREERDGVGGYRLYRKTGESRFFTAMSLCVFRLAKKAKK